MKVKDYWLACAILCPLSLLGTLVIFGDPQGTIFAGVVTFNLFGFLGKYLEAREIKTFTLLPEKNQKEKKDAGQPTEPT